MVWNWDVLWDPHTRVSRRNSDTSNLWDHHINRDLTRDSDRQTRSIAFLVNSDQFCTKAIRNNPININGRICAKLAIFYENRPYWWLVLTLFLVVHLQFFKLSRYFLNNNWPNCWSRMVITDKCIYNHFKTYTLDFLPTIFGHTPDFSLIKYLRS